MDAKNAKHELKEQSRLASDMFRDSASTLITEASERAQVLSHDSDAESIHQLRVAVRRLRSIWWAYRPLLPEPERTRQEESLKLITTVAGKARDWDILVDLFVSRKERKRAPEFMDELIARRKHALQSSCAELQSIDVSATLRSIYDGAMFAIDKTFPQSVSRFARLGAASAERTLRKRMKRADRAKKTDYNAYHDVRKAAKRLRYALEFFDAESKSKHDGVLKALKDIQQRYGALNDVVASE